MLKYTDAQLNAYYEAKGREWTMWCQDVIIFHAHNNVVSKKSIENFFNVPKAIANRLPVLPTFIGKVDEADDWLTADRSTPAAGGRQPKTPTSRKSELCECEDPKCSPATRPGKYTPGSKSPNKFWISWNQKHEVLSCPGKLPEQPWLAMLWWRLFIKLQLKFFIV